MLKLLHLRQGLLFVYLDDILIFSETEEEHVQQVRLVLQCLWETKLYVEAEKYEFHAMSVHVSLVLPYNSDSTRQFPPR